MDITVRDATLDDVGVLIELYTLLEAELTALRPTWRLADGLAHPVDQAIADMVGDPEWTTYVGEIDGAALGFLFGRYEALLPQAHGSVVASVRYIFTHPQGREVGVAEAMIDQYMTAARADGVTRFDAHVSPGHRLSKNFFESHGFKARSIVMHRSDE